MNNPQSGSVAERVDATWKNICLLMTPVKELYLGIKHKTIPLPRCCGVAALASLLIAYRIDLFLFQKSHLGFLYPYNTILFWIYFYTMISMGFWAWAWYQTYLRQQLAKKLTDVFTNAGLKNRLGKFPNFISDRTIDDQSRKLRVTMSNLPLKEFEKAKSALETGLQVYIDAFKEERERGIVDIYYAHSPMPTTVTIDNIMAFPDYKFIVGKTRTAQIVSSLQEVPHILVGGPTKKGKSTFLRQLITTWYLNNKSCQFTLIDLKGGLEFQLFENLPRVKVIPNVRDAVKALAKIERLMNERMVLLKGYKCKDIEAYFALKEQENKKPDNKNVPKEHMDRHIIVIDEAADMFLASGHATVSEIQKGKKILVEVGRKGRAVGIHMICATQKPDSRSLSTDVKSNLTGALCLPMADDPSSIVVLGNGRATDLAPYPGRAIWKNISEMCEVQTPLLTEHDADALLKQYRIKSDAEILKSQNQEPNTKNQGTIDDELALPQEPLTKDETDAADQGFSD